ncbi:MAG TPA: SDR family oxidoreductase [Ilumatobacteraceae bacterium]|nr:SDR family oxidoreductase [Ilumatobacteraceae bacterium]
MSRVAIVTGGASGIGAATVGRLRDQGVSVAVFDRSGDYPVDVTDLDQVTAAVQRVRGEYGPIEILVNAAGVPAGGRVGDDSYVNEWNRAIAVNLTGTMHVARACLADLLASGHGRIVNVASTEGLGATRNTGPYSVSKHGVIGFTRSLAVDFGRTGLTANCVCPGPVLTGMTAAIPESSRDEFARRQVPVGRYAQPDEIAYVIVALTAPEASFINGAIIPVDGGMTAVG